MTREDTAENGREPTSIAVNHRTAEDTCCEPDAKGQTGEALGCCGTAPTTECCGPAVIDASGAKLCCESTEQ